MTVPYALFSRKKLVRVGSRLPLEQKMFDMATEATAYAKNHGLHTTYFAVDSTRADPALLRKMYTAVVKKSRVESVVVDTFGITSPQGMAEILHTVKK
jgi:isopropylmalate/homocitrate/citramalate synthase